MKTSRRGFLGGGMKLGGLAALGTLLGQKPDLLKEEVAPATPVEEPIVAEVAQPVPAAIKEAGQNVMWPTCSVTFSCMVASTNAAGWPFSGQIESLDTDLYGRHRWTKDGPWQQRLDRPVVAAEAGLYGRQHAFWDGLTTEQWRDLEYSLPPEQWEVMKRYQREKSPEPDRS